MQPNLTKFATSPQQFSNFSLSFLKSEISLSATFLVICLLIFWTCLSFWRKLLETFKGISGQSITPFNSIKNSGITSFMLSAINTWLQLKGILYFPKVKNKLELERGKVKLYCNQVFIADNIKEVIPRPYSPWDSLRIKAKLSSRVRPYRRPCNLHKRWRA